MQRVRRQRHLGTWRIRRLRPTPRSSRPRWPAYESVALPLTPDARRRSQSDDRRPHPLGELTVASGSQTLKAHGNRTRDSRDRKVTLAARPLLAFRGGPLDGFGGQAAVSAVQLARGATVLARPRPEPGGADLWRALLADVSTSPEAPRRAGRRRRRGLGAVSGLGRQDAPRGSLPVAP